MSDSNKNDPLEEFFQKKSGDYDISFRDEDWHALENRLDALDAQIASRNRRRLAAAAVLIIFSILSYFIYRNYQQIDSLNEQLSQQQNITAPAPADTTPSSAKALADDDGKDPGSTFKDTGKHADEEIASTQTDTRSQGNKIPSSDVENGSLAGDASKATSTDLNGIIAADIAVSEIQCPDCELSSLAFSDNFNEMEHTAGRNTSTLTETAGIALAGDSKTGTPLSAPISSQQNLSKFSIGVVSGPDLSSAGSFSNFYDTGSKIGLTIEYKINRKWAFSVGAIRSKVHYKADMQDYSPPEGYWYNGIQASLTRAECSLIDIPISLSYRFLHFENSRIYATAGVSSYIMLSEDYRFTYQSDQQNLPQRWKEDTGTTHFMSNAGFSLGYELDVTHNVSIRAEPFLKVPMRGVGWGNVDLYSMGSLFSLNYTL